MSQVKTHEYGKLLTVVDSLITFNNSTNILTDLEENNYSKVDSGDATYNIKIDPILNDLEVSYMPNLLKTIKELGSSDLNKIRVKLENAFSQLTLNKNKKQKRVLVKKLLHYTMI